MNRLAALLHRSVVDSRSDGQLLAAFLTERDEPAFAELVRRHGPLVWGVCRRSLPDRADAEDAFQATFLVLVRRAPRLTANLTVGPWLFKVAAWTVRNLRRKNARHLSRRSALPATIPDPHPVPEPTFEMDDILLALSERARAAVVLCHLQGLTHGEAAKQLGCPEGTVASLVSRGLAKLRAKFAGPFGVMVPAALSAATVRSAAAFSLSLPAASPAVVELTEGVLRMFWAKKLATAVAVGMVLIAGLGVVFGVRETPQAVAADPQSGDQAEMRQMMQKLMASQEKLQKDVEKLNHDLDKVSRELAADRVRSGTGLVAKPEGPTVTVVVSAPGQPRFKAVERRADGKVTWEATFAAGKPGDVADLRAYLTRARRDPNGPRAIRIEADKDALRDDVQAAAQVCRDVGGIEIDVPGKSGPTAPMSPVGPGKVRVETQGDPDAPNVTPVKLTVGNYARITFEEPILQAVPTAHDAVVTVAGAGNDTKVLMVRGVQAGTTDVLVTAADDRKHTLRVTVTEASEKH